MSQVSRPQALVPCLACGHRTFNTQKKVPWRPFAPGWQSPFDRQFLHSYRIGLSLDPPTRSVMDKESTQ